MADWTESRREPSLGDVLADPIILALMQRDHVDGADLERLFARLRERETAARRLNA